MHDCCISLGRPCTSDARMCYYLREAKHERCTADARLLYFLRQTMHERCTTVLLPEGKMKNERCTTDARLCCFLKKTMHEGCTTVLFLAGTMHDRARLPCRDEKERRLRLSGLCDLSRHLVRTYLLRRPCWCQVRHINDHGGRWREVGMFMYLCLIDHCCFGMMWIYVCLLRW